MPRIIIAIDGYSSCGKSTLAKELARHLGYRYIDTGAMYRAVTLYFIRNQIDLHHPELVKGALKHIAIDFRIKPETQQQETYLNNENIEHEIRVNPRVASVVSDVSAISEVRRFLVTQQQALGKEKGIVMDGTSQLKTYLSLQRFYSLMQYKIFVCIRVYLKSVVDKGKQG